METLTQNRIKSKMSFYDGLFAITEGNIGLMTMLPDVCKTAEKILHNSNAAYFNTLSTLDYLELYGDDLSRFFKHVCQDEDLKLLTIIWSFDIGLNLKAQKKITPPFARKEAIKEIVNYLRIGAHRHDGKDKTIFYPFLEAKIFIEKNSSIRLPRTDLN